MSFFSALFRPKPLSDCDAGLAALDRRDFAAAAEAFENCLRECRDAATIRIARFHLAECHTRLALLAWEAHEVEKARAEIDVALASNPPTAERHLIAAQISRRDGDPVGATRHIEAALACIPDLEPALALYALQCYEEGRTEEALTKAATLPGFDGRLHRFFEAHEQGDRDAATAHLAAVAAGYPDSLI